MEKFSLQCSPISAPITPALVLLNLLENHVSNSNPFSHKLRDWWRKSRRLRNIVGIVASVIYVVVRVVNAIEYLFKRWPIF